MIGMAGTSAARADCDILHPNCPSPTPIPTDVPDTPGPSDSSNPGALGTSTPTPSPKPSGPPTDYPAIAVPSVVGTPYAEAGGLASTQVGQLTGVKFAPTPKVAGSGLDTIALVGILIFGSIAALGFILFMRLR